MSRATTVASLALGLSAVLCLGAPCSDEKAPPPRRPARLYTNEDLERVRPFRAETGVLSTPAAPAAAEATEPKGGPPRDRRKRDEDYWRREAARVRERVRAMEERAAALRSQIAERAREASRTLRPRARSSAGGATEASLRARLDALERRILQTEDDLMERARREGALPGWLR